MTRDLVPVHDDETLRAARLGWNALLTLRKSTSIAEREARYIDKILDEMNRNSLFEKPGEVLQGPIAGDDLRE